MSTHVEMDRSNKREGGASFCDIKMKRHRFSEIVTERVMTCDTDNQSLVSDESGYGSVSDRNSMGKDSPKSSTDYGSEGELPEVKSEIKMECHGDNTEQSSMKKALFLPPPYYRGENSNMHIGVAYVSFPANGQSDEKEGLKIGLIPVMDGFMPFNLKGLAGIPSQSLPKGPQPLFMTTMPAGFVMTNSGPVIVGDMSDAKSLENSSRKHKLDSPSDGIKTCPSKKVMTKETEEEFIDHYTNGKFEYLGHLGGIKPKDASEKLAEQMLGTGLVPDSALNTKYDNKYPMVCGICNDRATGLHYGIITCEGCKGFFKRTVQNRRVYTCVGGSGDCEINKAQRNRCQYCRFKKCLQAGMVLAAVREDRMPGGRNSGEVYNLYKVKYKKHKRRDETKASKERGARSVSSMEHQIKTEQIKLRTMPGSVHQVPNLYSNGNFKSPIDQGNLDMEAVMKIVNSPTTGCSNTESFSSMYNGFEQSPVSSNMSSRFCSRSEVSVSDQSRMSANEYGHTIGTKMNTSRVGLNFGEGTRSYKDRQDGQNCNLINSHMGRENRHSGAIEQRFPNKAAENKGASQDSHIKSMEDKIYGYNQKGKYYFNGVHARSAVNYEQLNYHRNIYSESCTPLANCKTNVNMSVQSGESRNVVATSDQSKTVHQHNLPQVVDRHAILRKKLTGRDDEEIVYQNAITAVPLSHNPRLSDDYVSSNSDSALSRVMHDPSSRNKGSVFHSQQLDNPQNFNYQNRLISELIECDKVLEITGLYKITELLSSDREGITKILCGLGDKVVGKLVQWTKKLPFFSKIPIEVHSHILSSKWHELLLLITTAHKGLHSENVEGLTRDQLYECYIGKLQKYFEKLFHREITVPQLEAEVGEMMHIITNLIHGFVQMGLSQEEYVCLQVILLLNQTGNEQTEIVNKLQDEYSAVLRDYVSLQYPKQPNRLAELLLWLPHIQTASALLIKSKMIYIPFFLNC